jgi:hypothetical protein
LVSIWSRKRCFISARWLARASAVAGVGLVAAAGSTVSSYSPTTSQQVTAATATDTSEPVGEEQPNVAAAAEAEPGSGEGITIGYLSNLESVPIVHVISEGIRAQAEIAGVNLLFCDGAGDNATAPPNKLSGTEAGPYPDGLEYQGDARIGARLYKIACDQCHGPEKPNERANNDRRAEPRGARGAKGPMVYGPVSSDDRRMDFVP